MRIPNEPEDQAPRYLDRLSVEFGGDVLPGSAHQNPEFIQQKRQQEQEARLIAGIHLEGTYADRLNTPDPMTAREPFSAGAGYPRMPASAPLYHQPIGQSFQQSDVDMFGSNARLVSFGPNEENRIRFERQNNQGETVGYDVRRDQYGVIYLGGAGKLGGYIIPNTIDREGNVIAAEQHLKNIAGLGSSSDIQKYLSGDKSGGGIGAEYTDYNTFSMNETRAIDVQNSYAYDRRPELGEKAFGKDIYPRDTQNLIGMMREKTGVEYFNRGGENRITRLDTALSGSAMMGTQGSFYQNMKPLRESGKRQADPLSIIPGVSAPIEELPVSVTTGIGGGPGDRLRGQRISMEFSMTGLGITEGQGLARENLGYLEQGIRIPLNPAETPLSPGSVWSSSHHQLPALAEGDRLLGGFDDLPNVPGLDPSGALAMRFNGYTTDSEGKTYGEFSKYRDASMGNVKFWGTKANITPVSRDYMESFGRGADVMTTVQGEKRLWMAATQGFLTDAGNEGEVRARLIAHATQNMGMSAEEAQAAYAAGLHQGRGAEMLTSASMDWFHKGWSLQEFQDVAVSPQDIERWKDVQVNMGGEMKPVLEMTGEGTATIRDYRRQMDMLTQMTPESTSGRHLWSEEELHNMQRNSPEAYSYIQGLNLPNYAREIMTANVANLSPTRAGELDTISADTMSYQQAREQAQRELGDVPSGDLNLQTLKNLAAVHGEDQLIRAGDTTLPSLGALIANYTQKDSGEAVNTMSEQALNVLAQHEQVVRAQQSGEDPSLLQARADAAAGEFRTSLNELANTKSIIKRGYGTETPVVSGPASGIAGLPANQIALSQDTWAHHLRQLGVGGDEFESQMEAFKTGNARMAVQMWPESNAAAHSQIFEVRNVAELQKQKGFEHVRTPFGQSALSEETAQMFSKDFDADPYGAVAVAPGSKAVSAEDVRRLSQMGFGGEELKRTEQMEKRTLDRGGFRELSTQPLIDATSQLKQNPLSKMVGKSASDLEAKAEMGPAYNVWRREMAEFSDQMIQQSGLSQPQQRGLFESMSAMAMLPYQKPLDLEPITDESMIKLQRAAQFLSADSSAPGNRSMNPVFWEPGADLNTLVDKKELSNIKSTKDFANYVAKIATMYGSGSRFDEEGNANPDYDKMTRYLAQSILPTSKAVDEEAITGMQGFIQRTHESGKFDLQGFEAAVGQNSHDWLYGKPGDTDRSVMAAWMQAAPYDRAQKLSAANAKRQGMSAGSYGNAGDVGTFTGLGDTNRTVATLQSVRAHRKFVKNPEGMVEAAQALERATAHASFPAAEAAQEAIFGSNRSQVFAELQGGGAATPAPGSYEEELAKVEQFAASLGGGGGSGSPPPPDIPAGGEDEYGRPNLPQPSGSALVGGGNVIIQRPTQAAKIPEVGTLLGAEEGIGLMREQIGNVAALYRNAATPEERAQIAVTHKGLIHSSVTQMGVLTETEGKLRLNQSLRKQGVMAHIPEGVQQLFESGSVGQTVHDTDLLEDIKTLQGAKQIGQVASAMQRSAARMPGEEALIGAGASFKTLQNWGGHFTDPGSKGFEELHKALESTGKVAQEAAKNVKEFSGDVDKFVDVTVKAKNAGLKELALPGGGTVPIDEAIQMGRSLQESPELRNLRMNADAVQKEASYAPKDRLAKYREMSEDEQDAYRNEIAYGRSKTSAKARLKEREALESGEESIFSGQRGILGFQKGGSIDTALGQTAQSLSDPRFLWTANFVGRHLVSPFMDAAKDYQKYEANQELGLARVGGMNWADAMKGDLGTILRTQSAGEWGHLALGRQAYEAWSPMVNFAVGGGTTGGPLGALGAIGAPALGAYMIANKLPMLQGGGAGLIGAGIAGLGLAGYVASNQNNFQAMGRGFNLLDPEALAARAGATIGTAAQGVNAILGRPVDRDYINQAAFSGTLNMAGEYLASGEYSVENVKGIGAEGWIAGQSQGWKTVGDVYSQSQIIGAGISSFQNKAKDLGIGPEQAQRIALQYMRYHYQGGNYSLLPNQQQLEQRNQLDLLGVDYNAAAQSSLSADLINPATNPYEIGKREDALVSQLAGSNTPLQDAMTMQARNQFRGGVNMARFMSGQQLMTDQQAAPYVGNLGMMQAVQQFEQGRAQQIIGDTSGLAGEYNSRLSMAYDLTTGGQVLAGQQALNAVDMSSQFANMAIYGGYNPTIMTGNGSLQGGAAMMRYTSGIAADMYRDTKGSQQAQTIAGYAALGGNALTGSDIGKFERNVSTFTSQGGNTDALVQAYLIQNNMADTQENRIKAYSAVQSQMMSTPDAGKLADQSNYAVQQASMRSDLTNAGVRDSGYDFLGSDYSALKDTHVAGNLQRTVASRVRVAEQDIAGLDTALSGTYNNLAGMAQDMSNQPAYQRAQSQFDWASAQTSTWMSHGMTTQNMASNIDFMTRASAQQFAIYQGVMGGDVRSMDTMLRQSGTGLNLMDISTGKQFGWSGVSAPQISMMQNWVNGQAPIAGMSSGAQYANGLGIDWSDIAQGGQWIQGQINQTQAGMMGYANTMSKYMRNTGLAMQLGGGAIGANGMVVGGDSLAGVSAAFAQQGMAFNPGNGMSLWQVEDAQTRLSREQTAYSQSQQGQQLGLQQAQFELAGRQFYENWNLNQAQFQANTQYQRQEMNISRSQNLTQRTWQAEDFAYNRAQTDLQFGWQMEDADRNIRYARGRERTDLLRQKGREVIQHSMEVSHQDTQQERVKQEQKWEDEKFNREKAHFEQGVQFQQQEMDLQKKHFEENRELEKQRMALAQDNFKKVQEWTKEQQALEDQSRLLQRQQAVWSVDMQNKIGDATTAAQLKIAKLSNELEIMGQFSSDLQTAISNTVSKDGLPKLVDELKQLYQQTSTHSASTNGSGFGTTSTPGTSSVPPGYFPPQQNPSPVPYTGQGPQPATYAFGGMVGLSMPGDGAYVGFHTGDALKSFAPGGFTGAGMKHQIAGIVHKGEYVVPQDGALVMQSGNTEMIAILKEIRDLLRTIKGYGPARMSATIHNKTEKMDIDSEYNRVFGKVDVK